MASRWYMLTQNRRERVGTIDYTYDNVQFTLRLINTVRAYYHNSISHVFSLGYNFSSWSRYHLIYFTQYCWVLYCSCLISILMVICPLFSNWEFCTYYHGSVDHIISSFPSGFLLSYIYLYHMTFAMSIMVHIMEHKHNWWLSYLVCLQTTSSYLQFSPYILVLSFHFLLLLYLSFLCNLLSFILLLYSLS